MGDRIVLFENKTECCGCGACMNVCPKDAISMVKDECGFMYPSINLDACIQCGACKKVCAYQNADEKRNQPAKAFAAVNQNHSQLIKSASGGVFSAIASSFIDEGGAVFGAALTFEKGHAHPHHIMIESIDDLPKLQGSKYVQSEIADTYAQAKKELETGRKVLFSGTPCQIGGLYGYLRKDYENLFTIDVICHGVPNAQMYDDFLQIMASKLGAKEMTGHSFRDKAKGWGMFGKYTFTDASGASREKCIPARLTSYNSYFLDGLIYRENCYECKYACKDRVGDLTIGDFWGIGDEHPEYLGKDGYVEEDGISCILANTDKGLEICKSVKDGLSLSDSTFEKIKKKNGQLSQPMELSDKREKLLGIYMDRGYDALDAHFFKVCKKKVAAYKVFYTMPYGLRNVLKKMMK